MKHSIKKFQNVNHSLDFNDDNSVYFNDASALFLKIFGKNIHTYRKFHFFNIDNCVNLLFSFKEN